MSSIKDIVKKIPKWAWWLLPVAIVLLVFSFIKKGGAALWPWTGPPPRPVDPAAPPAISPKEAEIAREEVKEETVTEKEATKEKYDKEREEMEKWLRGDG